MNVSAFDFVAKKRRSRLPVSLSDAGTSTFQGRTLVGTFTGVNVACFGTLVQCPLVPTKQANTGIHTISYARFHPRKSLLRRAAHYICNQQVVGSSPTAGSPHFRGLTQEAKMGRRDGAKRIALKSPSFPHRKQRIYYDYLLQNRPFSERKPLITRHIPCIVWDSNPEPSD